LRSGEGKGEKNRAVAQGQGRHWNFNSKGFELRGQETALQKRLLNNRGGRSPPRPGVQKRSA